MPRPTPKMDARTKLLEAALSVIRSKGYSATSVDELCAAAAVTKGAFFHHFRSKDRTRLRRSGPLVGNDRRPVCRCALSRSRRPSRSGPGLSRVPQGPSPGWRAGVHLSCRHHGAGDLRDHACHPRSLRTQHHRPCRNAGSRYRSGDARAEHGTRLDGEIARAAHTGRHSGRLILAKATGGAEIAADSIDHLRRYIEMLFGVGTEQARHRTDGDSQ
jgi:TetR/AcrR family transcriptional regulator, transcriptional repressor for nem operon